MGTATHVCSFTDKLAALHHGLDGHVELLVSAVVLCDAAERIRDQLLLETPTAPVRVLSHNSHACK